MTVWLIYTFDHLVDAKKIKIEAVAPRHLFHQENFQKILIIWIMLSFCTAVLIYYTLYPITIYTGIVTGLLVFIHFLLLKLIGFKVSLFIQKEFGIAAIYTIGICIPALSINFIGIDCTVVFVIIQLFLLAFTNLMEFSFFEIQQDKIEKQVSVVQALGANSINRIVYGVIIANYIIAFATVIGEPHYTIFAVEFCLTIMNTVLLIIFIKQDYFSKHERYRKWGDGIFLLPAIILVIIEMLQSG